VFVWASLQTSSLFFCEVLSDVSSKLPRVLEKPCEYLRRVFPVSASHRTGQQTEDVVGSFLVLGIWGLSLPRVGKLELVAFPDNLRVGLAKKGLRST
jgi:hypothetical protein